MLETEHAVLHTVHLSDSEVNPGDGIFGDELSHLFPVGRHHLAVTTPGSIELDKSVPSAGLKVKVISMIKDCC